MNDQHHDLDAALRAHGGAPAHLPGFEERLLAGMEQADRDMGRERRGWLRIPLPGMTRRAFLATAVVAAAAIAVAVLVGLPGVSRIGGPEPVSAAEVIQKALDAISSGETLQADITERYVTSVTYPGPTVEYAVVRARMLARSDGSVRVTQTGALPGPGDPRPPEPSARGPIPLDPGSRDWAYDATSGLVCGYYESSESPRFCTQIIRGYPLGPPDRWANFQGDLSATALALQAGKAASVDTTTYDGRPAWVVTMSGSLALRAPDEVYSITIDQETCLPVRVQAIDQFGIVQFDYGLHDVRVDEPIPDAAFRFAPPAGTVVERSDAGFRRASLGRIAAGIGYDLLLPTWLPDGYRRQWSAVSARATTANGETRGRDVVAVQYARGFESLTVTTRTVLDPIAAAEADPVEVEPNWASIVQRPVQLTGGAFAGATAQVVVAPRITVPHLWVVKGDVMLTVAGRATAEELVAIAESASSLSSAEPAVAYPESPEPGEMEGFVIGANGWAFEPTVDILVSHLGLYDDYGDGLSDPHRVGIFDDETGRLIVSTTVGPDGELGGAFRWAAVDSPASLEAGRRYLIAAEYVPGDGIYDRTGRETWAAEIVQGRLFFSGAGFVAPRDDNPWLCWMGPNFRFLSADSPPLRAGAP